MSRSEEELMSAYAEGDEASFAELFRRCAPAVLALLRRSGSPTEAEDLTQQAFLQLHRARRDYRRGAPLRPWLMTIVRNVRRDHFRRLRRAPPVVPLVDEEPDERARSTEGLAARADVREAIRELPESQRFVVEEHWFQHLAFREIARRHGLSESAVKVRAHRAYDTLRRHLPDWAPEPPPRNPPAPPGVGDGGS